MKVNNYCECRDCLAMRGKEIKGTGDTQKRPFVSTNRPIPPQKKKGILTTRDLPTPEELEQKKKTDEILTAKKEKEKK